MNKSIRNSLIKLSNAVGVGALSDAAETSAKMLEPYCGEITFDALGSVIGWKRSGIENAPVLMLEAHIDEVGFIVTAVEKNGFIRVAPCGRADLRALAAADVTVYGDKLYPGVFTCTPPHLSAGEKGVLPEFEDMAIDIGTGEHGIRLGDFAGFSPNACMLTDTRVCGKAMDDRAGVAAILRCLELLGDKPLKCDIAIVFAVQEELGCRGSSSAAYSIDPDAAVAVDVSFAYTPDAQRHKCGSMGGGVMLGRAPVLDTRITARLVQLAKKESIPIQDEVMSGDTGTDADSISDARCGVPTALLSIPLKYMHTPVEVVDTDDIESAAKLMAAFTSEFGREDAI